VTQCFSVPVFNYNSPNTCVRKYIFACTRTFASVYSFALFSVPVFRGGCDSTPPDFLLRDGSIDKVSTLRSVDRHMSLHVHVTL